MTETTIAAILSVFVPLLVAALKKTAYAQSTNAIIAIVVYAVFGVAAVVMQGQPLTADSIVPSIAIFVTGGTVAYNLFWKNWGDPQVTAAARG